MSRRSGARITSLTSRYSIAARRCDEYFFIVILEPEDHSRFHRGVSRVGSHREVTRRRIQRGGDGAGGQGAVVVVASGYNVLELVPTSVLSVVFPRAVS